jgi:hypothetical protein
MRPVAGFVRVPTLLWERSWGNQPRPFSANAGAESGIRLPDKDKAPKAVNSKRKTLSDHEFRVTKVIFISDGRISSRPMYFIF